MQLRAGHRKRSTMGILILLAAGLILSCDNSGNTIAKQNLQQLDSLINRAEDSLSNNFMYTRVQADSAMTLAKDSTQFHKALQLKAASYLITGSYDTACAISRQTLRFCANIPQSPQRNTLVSSANNVLGIYFQQMGNADSAICCFKRAYEQYPTEQKEEALPNILINLADAYLMKGDVVSTAQYFRKALFVSDSLGITDKMGFPIYFGLGQLYMGMRDFEQSNTYFLLAEKSLSQRNLNEQFTFCNNRGNYYYYKEEYANALPWFHRARALVMPKHYDYAINLCELNLSDIHLHLNRLDSAKYYSTRSYTYFLSINQPTALYYLTSIKAGIALKENRLNDAKALLRNSSNTASIEPSMLSIRNEILQEYNEKVGNYKQAYHFQKQNVDIENASMSERIKNRVADLDMQYRQDTTILKRDMLIQAQSNRMKYLLLTKIIWILISISIVVAAVFIYFYMRKQRDWQHIQHLDQMTKLRMENIRNRISPHFIFNILNHEIIANNNEKQQTELRGVVKLLRSSLEMSERLDIPLKQELEFVQTYIDIEKKSLGEDFSLQLMVDDSVDCETLHIPSMIIQIPVENAIKHALRGKEGVKQLRITVGKRDTGVGITIEDNGAGYKPNTFSKKGTGTGLKVIYQTIQLLNIRNNTPIGFNISNKSTPYLCGTTVDISIPENYSYKL